jgi:hypothetical protein
MASTYQREGDSSETPSNRDVGRHCANAWSGDVLRLWHGGGATPDDLVNLSLEDEYGERILTIVGLRPTQLARFHALIGLHLGIEVRRLGKGPTGARRVSSSTAHETDVAHLPRRCPVIPLPCVERPRGD